MRWPSIKPVGGWPTVIQDVLIVVVGVLIALGAQEMVDRWHWRGEIREFRDALDKEIGYNLGANEDRLGRSSCLRRRLDQLDEWMSEIKAGHKAKLVTPIARPLTLAARNSVWESRTPEAASHLGLEHRLTYAGIYDSVDLLDNIGSAERSVWNELTEFEGAGDLDRRDIMRLRGLIERARFLDRVFQMNGNTFRLRTARLGIRPWREADDPSLENGLCVPLRWVPA